MVATWLDYTTTDVFYKWKFQSPKMRINGCNCVVGTSGNGKKSFQSPKMRINGCNYRDDYGNTIGVVMFQSPKMRINGCNRPIAFISKLTRKFQSPKMRINGCNCLRSKPP